MNHWLKEFLSEFPNATERETGIRQELHNVELQVIDSRQRREITVETLRTIEYSQDWNYPIWWPSFSKHFGAPIKLPADLDNVQARKAAIEALYERLRHIEVVSVVLRFTFPEHFGIISPPVSHILNLPPSKDHISYYMHYLEVLARLQSHSGLPRIADVDMALWSAAHSQRELAAITECMYRDEYFQELRLENIFEGLRVLHDVTVTSARADRQLIEHLLIARALLTYDYVLASLICGRSYEFIIDTICSRWDIPKGTSSYTESEFRHRLKTIGRHPDFSKLGCTLSQLNRLRDWRNSAVHPEHKISRKEATEFVEQTSALGRALMIS